MGGVEIIVLFSQGDLVMPTAYTPVLEDLDAEIAEREQRCARLKEKRKKYRSGLKRVRAAEDMDVADLKAKVLADGCASLEEIELDHEISTHICRKIERHDAELQKAEKECEELCRIREELQRLEAARKAATPPTS